MEKSTPLVPNLRFPEYRRVQEWKKKSLNKLAHIRKGVQLNREKINDGEYPVWNGGLAPSGFHDEWNTNGETITISEGGNSCGFVSFCKQRFWLGGHCYALEDITPEIEKGFLYQSLKTNETMIKRLRVGSGLPNIQRGDLERFSIVYPDIPEQKKVAEFVSSLDDLIEAESQKLETLLQHKKGLMQQLFPQSGETLPRLRFPEFRNLPEWGIKKIRDAISKSKENFDPKKSQETPQLVELANIESKTGRLLGVVEIENQKSLKSRFQPGDVLFGKLRPYLQKFARPDFPGVCTTEIWVLRSKAVSSKFLFYLVQTEQFSHLASKSCGSRMPRAEWDVLAAADFAFADYEEQSKIADCLSSLDNLIDAESQKLEVLRQLKQGLLQQLFPVIED